MRCYAASRGCVPAAFSGNPARPTAPPMTPATGPAPHRRLAGLVSHLNASSSTTAATTAPPTSASDRDQQQQRRHPDGSWSGASGSDPELDAAVALFREQGYLKIPHLLTGELLTRTTAAFKASQVEAYEDWRQGLLFGAERGGQGSAEGRGAPGTWHAPRYFDTPKILEVDDVFLEVIEEPWLLALASRIVSDDLHLFQIQARTYPCDENVPSTAAQLEPGQPGVISQAREVDGGLDGYTGWHRDMAVDRPDRCQHLVVMIYFSGATADSGATAVVPGSHLSEDGAPGGILGLELPDSVPGEVEPGGAMLFDGRTWHTALPNHSNRDRETLTIRYIPFQHRSLGAVTNNAVVLDAAGKLDTPIRRQLLGLDYADGRANWFDPVYCEATPRPDLR
jgi:hypothetical protein